MIHELRIYRCMPGKLQDLGRRFQATTLKIWEKHGIRPLGFWTTVIGDDSQALYCLLEWESLAERETCWRAFSTDAEWLAARAESEKAGQITLRSENQILSPTSYSKLR